MWAWGCARVIDGKRRGSSSVEEEISQVLVPKFRVRVLSSTASCSGYPAVLACVVDCGAGVAAGFLLQVPQCGARGH